MREYRQAEGKQYDAERGFAECARSEEAGSKLRHCLARGDPKGRDRQGREEGGDGLSREASPFYEYVLQIAFSGANITPQHEDALRKLITAIVEMLQETIAIIGFWDKPTEVKRLRGNIDTEILLTGVPELSEKHERIAVEIVKLAEKRHSELVK